MGVREAIASIEFDERVAAKSAPEPAFVEEVAAGLPAGDDLTAAELRVDYLLEKIAEERTRLDHLEEFTRRRMDMILEHKSMEAGKIERRLAWLESRVREHMPFDAASFRKHYGAKSHRLPHGQIGYRASRASVEITDPAKALAFAKARGLEIKVSESVNKTPLLESVMRDGEEPNPETDGFRFVPPQDEFFVNPE